MNLVHHFYKIFIRIENNTLKKQKLEFNDNFSYKIVLTKS